ncbi:hypothetical protein CgunFtcFv8_018378 [Champsocephalus gunnari]|uniref:Uncharacterized protein n=1 Tax=Champsocephalus gunnari TaxID=52237 RepID=A0AAN8BTZ4_CHAGU|nr:hypothetical protein CgunFtcFv8_018378 [Champsocephalus gunnari]
MSTYETHCLPFSTPISARALQTSSAPICLGVNALFTICLLVSNSHLSEWPVRLERVAGVAGAAGASGRCGWSEWPVWLERVAGAAGASGRCGWSEWPVRLERRPEAEVHGEGLY